MNEKGAVVLLSGGLDSSIVVMYLRANGYDVKAGVFVNRSQSNYDQELTAVRKVAEYFEIPLLYADFSLPDLSTVLSKEMRKKLGNPARNLILGAVALPYVYALDCHLLALGNIVSDEFPDCNKEFRMKFTAVVSQALDKKVEVVAPLADWEHWDKTDGISFVEKNGHSALFSLTWTCWLNGELHCGHCTACEGRKDGFIKAGLIDPTHYEENRK